MAWQVPRFSRGEVDRAGDVLRRPAEKRELESALEVVNNWRVAHSYPLNTYQSTLRRKAARVDPFAIVAQRIKRLSSIRKKLQQLEALRLSRMNDIGGCRAVVLSVEQVRELVASYLDRQHHQRALQRSYDYVAAPKVSGYRSVHLVFRYRSRGERRQVFDGLRVEMQIRTVIQHAWATAVETVDLFTFQRLKAGRGDEQWHRFFALMGSVLSLEEGGPPVPGTPTKDDALIQELREAEARLGVADTLEAMVVAVRHVPRLEGATYFLLTLDVRKRRIDSIPFRKEDQAKAQLEYQRLERKYASVDGVDTVLVSVADVDMLERAYPNYFFDTARFVGALLKAIR